ncbi:MAG: hypothetical protein ACJAT7_002499 [Psychromonas sp.]|jgi:hypothetical protein|uniref:CDP-archaeol synthase n=1 Tax=Psychromonas sp. TaxID=1884585 RepID=UPI0039E695AF
MLAFKLLLILIAANGIPAILHRCMGTTLSQPIDGGRLLGDGYPLFGHSKTWRGLFTGIVGAAIIATLLGFTPLFGLGFGAAALLGDLLSSFIKRRLRRPSSSKFLGLDQIPEALLPLVTGAIFLDYGVTTIAVVTLLFFLLNILTSRLLYQWGIRQHPH